MSTTTSDRKLAVYRDNQHSVIADGLIHKSAAGAYSAYTDITAALITSGATIGSADATASGTVYLAQSSGAIVLTDLTAAFLSQTVKIVIDVDDIDIVVTPTAKAIQGLGSTNAKLTSYIEGTADATDKPKRGDEIVLHQFSYDDGTAVEVSTWSIMSARGKGWALTA